MLDTHTDIARAAIEATFLPRRATFPRDIDHSRRVLAASRELLKRLRQSHGDDTSRAWEDADPVPFAISAFDADVLRAVFKDLVLGTYAPKCRWRDLAKTLVLEYAGCDQVEVGLLDWITRK
ncbi:hypothetical protein FJ959_23080 [Mesorhizobium sp. B2-2-4]|uniref:hypothetical protein n=1 Tax=unclassified Mesorhizobium TaxID=325217 RepID=UPI0011271BD0|nr:MULTISPECIES: hypothetical protein [unclassified Mesorhizobium]MCA0055521.1 hypothetical protein [Mesorhizobium sp. B261B1A]TPL14410.1 hypothetical protein FJ944_02585 [Mesorhizobium sp. B2-4-11]TPL17337.1 hypothetical protein FJ952_15700 [Mesorhizobium sp. B2-4-10]TPL50231.1 hypothetical protein FJ942_23925 [Mesorhizobium sp. B2-4-2]TPM52277.1 hypothetical protein FJ959_23080 [Mesorhizobium sp. B2-2-4]